MLLAGLAGRAPEKALVIDCCRGREGAIGVIGVMFGVGWLDNEDEVLRVEILDVVGVAGTLPSYAWPNSPGVNETQEQKPSEDVMTSRRPSLDLNIVRAG
jgi:hypothetical protein